MGDVVAEATVERELTTGEQVAEFRALLLNLVERDFDRYETVWAEVLSHIANARKELEGIVDTTLSAHLISGNTDREDYQIVQEDFPEDNFRICGEGGFIERTTIVMLKDQAAK